MKQPSIYSKIQIIEASLDLIRKSGWEAVTARKIAQHIGCSTMPIYSYISSIDELKSELLKISGDLLLSYQKTRYTENILLNLALGYITFARDERNVFRFLFDESHRVVTISDAESLKTFFISQFYDDTEILEAVSVMDDNDKMIKYSWIFTHGLAAMVNSSTEVNFTNEVLIELLTNAAKAFYTIIE